MLQVCDAGEGVEVEYEFAVEASELVEVGVSFRVLSDEIEDECGRDVD